METNQNHQAINLQVTEGLSVAVIQDSSHEFLLTTKDVAKGYGISEETVRSHRSNHKDELIEGTHFLGVENINAGGAKFKMLFWTKKGVIRLGMFIKSERAKLFRDWAENVILRVIEAKAPVVPSLPKAPSRNHNRLTSERMIDILADVAMIDDKALRLSLISKLLPNKEMPAIQLQLPIVQKGGENVHNH